jgi:hypothetical protein
VFPVSEKTVRASRREIKDEARKMLMHGIGTVLGYWHEDWGNRAVVEGLGVSREEFGQVLMAEADRVARLLGYTEAWCD